MAADRPSSNRAVSRQHLSAFEKTIKPPSYWDKLLPAHPAPSLAGTRWAVSFSTKVSIVSTLMFMILLKGVANTGKI
jgi:hypothetical protein